MSKKKYYAIAKGRKPGIYDVWSGEDGAEAHIKGFSRAVYKGFASLADAKRWYISHTDSGEPELFLMNDVSEPIERFNHQAALRAGKVVIYTDGGCIGNPGPGGYGVVLLYGKTRKELSGGFRLTTNNRMELMACIRGLKTLKPKSTVVLYSDSKYIVDSIREGWAEQWRANRWMRTKREKAENSDLWALLLGLCDKHDVQFVWVEGHAGNPENERCDRLSIVAARKRNLPPDTLFEKHQAKNPTLFEIG